MYRIAVCDDDAQMRAFIKKAVEKAQISCQIEEYEDGGKLVSGYKEYDILILDIDMPVLNGIDTAYAIRRFDKRVKIIYVTGYADYMQKSFSVHPFSFLVKPVSEPELIRQLKEAVSYEAKPRKEELLRFHTEDGIEEFEVPDIYYMEYQSRKIRLSTKRGDYIIKGRITDLAQSMEPYGFACPHKSFSVNLYYVKSIKGYDIYMLNGDMIPLSQKRSSRFRNVLGNFQAEYI